jgi:hypothetical protein
MAGKGRYQIDAGYFDHINTAEKAYWLGAIWADGSIYRRKNRADSYVFSFEVKDSDILWVQSLKIALNSDHPITTTHKGKATRIQINNKRLCKSLISQGIALRKSYVNSIPIFPRKFTSQFIRGVFDGDGSVSWNKANNSISISIVGNQSLVTNIKKYLKFGSIFPRKNKNNLWQISISGNQCAKNFANIIYNDNGICLKRKKQRFDLYIGEVYYS